eukprot:CAMPEP_0176310706 /NCGR_PEP_ID=MMETSP0121_2-20121125/65744_1 /TAXON_ID=160619 /ORGANISM="Kryptoperidinium foliaceum, Strain CCMP 1326" /LENGTH=32 /DNA_ID= /DNA_START= /DNA_END= /DNA_ORIENTATION=
MHTEFAIECDMGHGGTKNISGRRSSTCKNSAK